MCFNYKDDKTVPRDLVVTSVIFLAWMILIELMQLKADGMKYFKRYYNKLDMIIILGHLIWLALPNSANEVEDYDEAVSTQLFSSDSDDWNAHPFTKNQVLTVVAFLGIFRGLATLFNQVKYTRFLTYMVERTIKELVPFMIFCTG